MDTSAWDFRRLDEDDDSAFYSVPRRVVHIDDGAIAALTQLYAALVPTGGRVLDLMASWRSHLPETCGGTAIGHGDDDMLSRRLLLVQPAHDVGLPC